MTSIRSTSFGSRYRGAALITGASSGIGAAFAHELAKDGTDVILVARRGDRLSELAQTLRAAHGVSAHVCALDLLSPDAVPRIESFLAERGLAVGLLVNNAGFAVPRPFRRADPAALDAMIRLHCNVPVALTRALVPAMIARGRGAVILVASVAGYLLSPSSSVYGATKAFDLHLGESLWAELSPLGIDVLALSPGYTRTEFQEVAGITGLTDSRWVWSLPEDVAREGLSRLGRQASAVAGWQYKALCTAVRLVPRAWVNRLAVPLFFRKLSRLRADDGKSPGA
jgi:short-subunit dehydrogenase